jgi:hypothetical protein
MAPATNPDDELKDRPSKAPRWTSAVLAIVAIVMVSVAVASRSADHDVERDRDPLDLADPTELRQVVVAISEVIRATEPAAEDHAIDALAHLTPQSPGAADLRDACLTTYRSPREADRLLREGARLLPADGGAAPPEATPRLEEISHRARTLITEARETLERCNALYQAGARRIGIEPAHRGR